MQLEHSFSVPVGIDEAWPILIDIERIGPCMPGAAIDSVDGDEFTGTVKVKLGPINLTYKGKAAFIEKDADARRAVIDARGRDARGNGTASAKITATLHEEGSGTLVKVITDLDITGKPAQFGRGVMVDVGNKLLGQFADTLAKTLKGPDASAGDAEPAAGGSATGDAAPANDSAASNGATARKTTAKKAAPTKAAPAAKRTRPKPPVKAGDEPAAEAAAPVEPAAENAAENAGSGATAAAAATASAVGRSAVPDPQPEAEPAASPARRSIHDVEPIDLLHHAGPAVAKRLAPVAVALVVVLIAVRRHRRQG